MTRWPHFLCILATTLVGLCLSTGGALAAADPGLLPDEEEVVVAEKEDKGWDPSLKVGASLALSSNANVVGQPNGSSWTVGINLSGRLDYAADVHDWRNKLVLQEVISRTPTIDEWIKTADQFLFESTYYLRVNPKVGPFFTFKLDTALLAGQDVRAAKVNYVDADKAEGEEGRVIAADTDRLSLTDSFQPLVLKQSLGAFYTPLSEKEIEVDVKAGFGAHQTFAEGGRVVTEASADEVSVRGLSDFIQAGAVIGAEIKGELEGGRVAYSLHGEVMFPVINSDDQDRDVLELTNYDFGAKVGFKIFDWASLDYQFKAYRQPQLVDAWQIQNSLLLTLSYSLIE